jgi:hypothetical protein
MRKLALLLAAALFVSVPLIAATPSVTYAAAKKKAAAKETAATTKGARRGGREGAEGGGEDLNEVNSRFWRAINDLSISLSKPWPTAADQGGGGSEGGAGRPAKGRNGKKSRS